MMQNAINAIRSNASRGPRRALVVGGSGALGKACVDAFVAAEWDCISADLKPNDVAKESIVLDAKTWKSNIAKLVADDYHFDAVVCAAGGWSGGAIGVHDDAIDGAEAMIEACYKPALTTTTVAYERLRLDGTFVLVGAAAALGPTPGMVGYGMAKAATHFLGQCAAAPKAEGGLEDEAHVMVIAPNVIDTPANRMAMPDSDFLAWTPPEVIADFILQRAQSNEGRAGAKRGEILEPVTRDGVTDWKLRA